MQQCMDFRQQYQDPNQHRAQLSGYHTPEADRPELLHVFTPPELQLTYYAAKTGDKMTGPE